jgi:hypothetical protein
VLSRNVMVTMRILTQFNNKKEITANYLQLK